MISIYTDKSYLTEQYRGIIFPLLFHYWYLQNMELQKLYTLTDTPDEAAIVIVPVHIEFYFSRRKTGVLYGLIDSAIAKGKRVWVYTSGDLGLTLNRKVTTFRFGGFDSKLDPDTVIIPAHTFDPYQILKHEFCTIPKSDIPQIGFTGNAHKSLWKWIKELYVHSYYAFHRFRKTVPSDYQEFYPSGIRRYDMLREMQADTRIKTDFIFRKAYRAGAKTESERERTKQEFFENLFQNPYTFCIRGTGNFSVRFYETLAVGRIPVLVDTDTRLPLSRLIDWEKHCVLVSEKNPVDGLVRFHKNIDPADFENMQSENRKLWLKYLDGGVFFKGIYDSLQTESKSHT